MAIVLHGALGAGEQRAEAERFAIGWRRDRAADRDFVHDLGERATAGGDRASAEEKFRTVLAAQPGNAGVMNTIAWLLDKPRKPAAWAMAENALPLQPDNPSRLDTLALAQHADNSTAKSLETQRRTVALRPKGDAMRLRPAQWLIKEGKKSDARQALETLVKLGPAFAQQGEVQAMLKALWPPAMKKATRGPPISLPGRGSGWLAARRQRQTREGQADHGQRARLGDLGLRL